MQRLRAHLDRGWYRFLTENQQKLAESALDLYECVADLKESFFDYSFIVFPMSKVYEGFLKKYLFELSLISLETYEGKKFRIGRSLNPDVSPRHRDKYWHYDNVEKICGKEVSRQMWNTWLKCRNRIFHYFPKKQQTITLQQAHDYLELLMESMEQLTNCKEQHG